MDSQTLRENVSPVQLIAVPAHPQTNPYATVASAMQISSTINANLAKETA